MNIIIIPGYEGSALHSYILKIKGLSPRQLGQAFSYTVPYIYIYVYYIYISYVLFCSALLASVVLLNLHVIHWIEHISVRKICQRKVLDISNVCIRLCTYFYKNDIKVASARAKLRCVRSRQSLTWWLAKASKAQRRQSGQVASQRVARQTQPRPCQ